MNFDYINAMMNIRPGAKWVHRGEGDDYSGFDWFDETQDFPSKEELDTEVARLQAEYDSKEYQRLRANSYPSIVDQLDMLYWDKINNTNNWEEARTAVKQQYPKPESTG